MNIKEIAALFGMKDTEVYGLLNFMVAAGVLTRSKADKMPGKTGKPAFVYHLDLASAEALRTLIVGKLNDKEYSERPSRNMPKVEVA